MMRVQWDDGDLLCCRTCDRVEPHYSSPPSNLKCGGCYALTHILTVTATYALEDDYADPGKVQLPRTLGMLTATSESG